MRFSSVSFLVMICSWNVASQECSGSDYDGTNLDCVEDNDQLITMGLPPVDGVVLPIISFDGAINLKVPNYEIVGQGHCIDVYDRKYDRTFVYRCRGLDTCAATCLNMQESSGYQEIGSRATLRGFEYHRDISRCFCLYDNGIQLPEGMEGFLSYRGIGPISNYSQEEGKTIFCMKALESKFQMYSPPPLNLTEQDISFTSTELGKGDCRNPNGQFYDRFFLYSSGVPSIVDGDPSSCYEPCVQAWLAEGITEELRGHVHSNATADQEETICSCLVDNLVDEHRYPLTMTTKLTFATGPIFESTEPNHPSHTCVKLERDEEVNVEHPSDAPSANPSDAPTENLRASFLGKGVPVDSRGLDFNFVVFPDVTDPVRCELKCGFDSAKGMAIDRKQKHCVCIWEGDIGEEETYPGNVGYFDFAFGSGEIHIDELQEQNVDVYTFNYGYTSYPSKSPTTSSPTESPTLQEGETPGPTESPTAFPSVSPSTTPSASPSADPSKSPSSTPTGTPTEVCPTGTIYSACGTCQRTCETKDLVCAQVCNPGCFCPNGGYYDNSVAKCVSSCPEDDIVLALGLGFGVGIPVALLVSGGIWYFFKRRGSSYAEIR
jgi:hypothetical protein